MSAIQKYDGVNGSIQIQSMDDLHRVSKMLSMSGYFADAKDAAQCGVKVLAGAEMGIGAFSAMSGIHIIKGKPSIGSHLMAAAVKRHPNYNYKVLVHNSEICRIEFYERWDGKWEPVGISEFTIAEAQTAGTQNINKYPKNMLFARAISNGVKFYCPDVFDAPVYTPDELGVEVDGDGNAILPPPTPKQITLESNEPEYPFGQRFATQEDSNSVTITEPQRRKLFAVAKENGWTPAQIKPALIDQFDVESTSDILVKDFDQVLDFFKSHRPPEDESQEIEQQEMACGE